MIDYLVTVKIRRCHAELVGKMMKRIQTHEFTRSKVKMQVIAEVLQAIGVIQACRGVFAFCDFFQVRNGEITGLTKDSPQLRQLPPPAP